MEQVVTIRESLKAGLRADDRAQRDEMQLIEARNVRCGPHGLEISPTVVDPFHPDDLLGVDKITNGLFTDNAASWTLPTGWAHGSGKVTHTPGNVGPMFQASASMVTPLVTGKVYRLTYTVADRTAGTIIPAVGVLGVGTLVNANATYTEDITCLGTLQVQFTPSTDFDGSIDTVTLKEVVTITAWTWPFPQLFRGQSVTLLADETNVYVVNENDWTLTAVSTFDPASPFSNKSIAADGGPWHFVDMGPSWMLMNDTNTIHYLNIPDEIELVVDQDFTDTTNWTLGTGTSIDTQKGILTIVSTGMGNATYTGITVAVGQTYQIEIFYERDFTANSELTATIGNSSKIVQTGTVGPTKYSNTFNTAGTSKLILTEAADPTPEAESRISHVRVYRVGKYAGKAFVDTTNLITTGCAVREQGRFLLAGFNPGDSYGIWSTLPSNAVLWSSIGMEELADYFFGSVTTDNVMDLFEKRNDAGYMVMPFQGPILAIKRLREAVMVYGENGVAALKPYYSEEGNGYGIVSVLDQGILSRSAVGGDKEEHLWIDPSGYLWKIGNDLRPMPQDYQHLMDGSYNPLPGSPDDPGDLSAVTMLDKVVVISFDPKKRDFFICGVDPTASPTPTILGYILSPYGMGRTDNLPTSVYREGGDLIGLSVPTDFTGAVDVANDFWVLIDTFDLGTKRMKTIRSIELGGQLFDMDNTTVKVFFQTDRGEPFKSTDALYPDGRGRVRVFVTGFEFRIEVRATLYTTIELDYVRVVVTVGEKQSVKSLLS
jgi:hypothetical protein